MTGAEWPGPSLGLLGICIAGSALVDRQLWRRGLIDGGLWRLRLVLSLGLGSLTLILAMS